MDALFERSAAEAKSYLTQIGDSAMEHTESVVGFALELAEHFPDAEKGVIELGAWWHDTGRLWDPHHEELSARLAAESIGKLGADSELQNRVHEAIANHKWSMTPQTIEGEIVRDADKLDWVSVSRWQRLLEEGELETLRSFAESLSVIRDNILHLEPSRQLFDRNLEELARFVATVNSPEFREIGKLVIDWVS